MVEEHEIDVIISNLEDMSILCMDEGQHKKNRKTRRRKVKQPIDFFQLSKIHHRYIKEYLELGKTITYDKDIHVKISADDYSTMVSELKSSAPSHKSVTINDLPFFQVWFLNTLKKQFESVLSNEEKWLKFTHFTEIKKSFPFDDLLSLVIKEALDLFFIEELLKFYDVKNGLLKLARIQQENISLHSKAKEDYIMKQIMQTVSEVEKFDHPLTICSSKKLLKLAYYYVPPFTHSYNVFRMLIYSPRTREIYLNKYKDGMGLLNDDSSADITISRLDEIAKQRRVSYVTTRSDFARKRRREKMKKDNELKNNEYDNIDNKDYQETNEEFEYEDETWEIVSDL